MDTDNAAEWERRVRHVCKPCWELKYCPYGILIEEFPLLPPTRAEAIGHNEFLKKQLGSGTYAGSRKELIERMVEEFDPNDYPETHSKETFERSCSIYGHLCPVFSVNEPFTETKEARRISRNIPRNIMFKVVRRDNYTCQICSKHLKDNELFFDHKIPFSKGGSTEEHNLQLLCFECNKKVATDYLRKKVRCPYCGSKILFKSRSISTKVKAR